jgi:hypothetical protein
MAVSSTTILIVFASLCALMLVTIVVLVTVDLSNTRYLSNVSYVDVIIFDDGGSGGMAQVQVDAAREHVKMLPDDKIVVYRTRRGLYGRDEILEDDDDVEVVDVNDDVSGVRLLLRLLTTPVAEDVDQRHFMFLGNSIVTVKNVDPRVRFRVPHTRNHVRFAGRVAPDLQLLDIVRNRDTTPLVMMPYGLLHDREETNTMQLDSLLIDDEFSDSWQLVYDETLVHYPLTRETLSDRQSPEEFVCVSHTREQIIKQIMSEDDTVNTREAANDVILNTLTTR